VLWLVALSVLTALASRILRLLWRVLGFAKPSAV